MHWVRKHHRLHTKSSETRNSCAAWLCDLYRWVHPSNLQAKSGFVALSLINISRYLPKEENIYNAERLRQHQRHIRFGNKNRLAPQACWNTRKSSRDAEGKIRREQIPKKTCCWKTSPMPEDRRRVWTDFWGAKFGSLSSHSPTQAVRKRLQYLLCAGALDKNNGLLLWTSSACCTSYRYYCQWSPADLLSEF